MQYVIPRTSQRNYLRNVERSADDKQRNYLRNGVRRWQCSADDLMQKSIFFKELLRAEC